MIHKQKRFCFICSAAAVITMIRHSMVANRTIQRMIDQQKLHHTLARFLHQIRRRFNIHPRHHRHRARRHRLWTLLHLHQTHPTVPRDRELVVITKPRHINSRAFARIEHGDALGHLNLPSIHRHRHGIYRRRRRRQNARLHLRSRENTQHNIPSVIHASIAHRIPSRARDASSFVQSRSIARVRARHLPCWRCALGAARCRSARPGRA